MKTVLPAMGYLTSPASFFISDWKLLGLSNPHPPLLILSGETIDCSHTLTFTMERDESSSFDLNLQLASAWYTNHVSEQLCMHVTLFF